MCVVRRPSFYDPGVESGIEFQCECELFHRAHSLCFQLQRSKLIPVSLRIFLVCVKVELLYLGQLITFLEKSEKPIRLKSVANLF